MERLENETKNEDDNDSGNFFIISFSSSNNQFHKSLISISQIKGVAKCFYLFNVKSYIGIFGCIVICIDLKLLFSKNTQKVNKQKFVAKIRDL